jgi:hypothetical protein
MLIIFEGKFTSFFKEKVIKKSQNSRNQGFSYYFCLMMEGSGSRSGAGSVLVTNGLLTSQEHKGGDRQKKDGAIHL